MKNWGIIAEGKNNAIIVKATREENGFSITAETETIAWKWRVSDKIVYDALITPALDAGWTGTADENYKGLAEWLTGKGIVVWHTDTKKPGAFRHRYYINEFVEVKPEEKPEVKVRRIAKEAK